ncbi:DUF2802 domain-containing protein [Orenia marismortui]|uniref:Uncharacterized protein DUF2802 n=1 Tax=Orenia marismortui TaxID=46469 RepID=A0A4R8GZC4_9FIRM|nr:DUF2802 domain-containing protein [Orenia marismortui]TDX51903.1 uncharacterized protein DUF2802 [Orenia marismortui]
MEYILFVAGIVIIFISLFLTHRAQSDNDQYFLENEMISEVRILKKDLESKLENISKNKNDFNHILNNELNNNVQKKELAILNEKLEELIFKVEEFEFKLEGISERLNHSNNLSKLDNIEKTPLNNADKNNEYQEIKKLIDQGLSIVEVAQKLDMGSREVELIYKFNSRREI